MEDIDRDELAERRLLKVLKANIVASARTLEQKISDSGPNPMRVDPHVLTTARKRLEEEGLITYKKMGEMRWYHLTGANPAKVEARLEELVPIHKALGQSSFGKRLGQTLEIAAYRAFIQQPQLRTFGAFLNLDKHDDSTLYQKEEPPSAISGRLCSGSLDFILGTKAGGMAGVEIKNVREWMYIDRTEIRELLRKCTSLDIVPVLIARRIPFVTFKLLHACGAIIHQTYNQLFPLTDTELAEKAKDKDLLGYHDVRLGNKPDARLLKFAVVNLPNLIDSRRPVFDEFKDLLESFSTGGMSYVEFAARVRRRLAGTNEDGDWEE